MLKKSPIIYLLIGSLRRFMTRKSKFLGSLISSNLQWQAYFMTRVIDGISGKGSSGRCLKREVECSLDGYKLEGMGFLGDYLPCTAVKQRAVAGRGHVKRESGPTWYPGVNPSLIFPAALLWSRMSCAISMASNAIEHLAANEWLVNHMVGLNWPCVRLVVLCVEMFSNDKVVTIFRAYLHAYFYGNGPFIN